MTASEALRQAAEMYERDGYAVAWEPADTLPAELRRPYPAFVANKPGASVLVEAWQRGQVQDAPPEPLPKGWHFDAILLPRPADDTAATPEFADRLRVELDELLPRGAILSRFLIAGCHLEAALRLAAERDGISTAGQPADELLAGMDEEAIPPARRFRLRQLLAKRALLLRGLPPGDVTEADVLALAEAATELRTNALVPR